MLRFWLVMEAKRVKVVTTWSGKAGSSQSVVSFRTENIPRTRAWPWSVSDCLGGVFHVSLRPITLLTKLSPVEIRSV